MKNHHVEKFEVFGKRYSVKIKSFYRGKQLYYSDDCEAVFNPEEYVHVFYLRHLNRRVLELGLEEIEDDEIGDTLRLQEMLNAFVEKNKNEKNLEKIMRQAVFETGKRFKEVSPYRFTAMAKRHLDEVDRFIQDKGFGLNHTVFERHAVRRICAMLSHDWGKYIIFHYPQFLKQI